MPIWLPDPTAVEGWNIEVPVRSPTLPVNLWVHWSGISLDRAGFPPPLTDGVWHRGFGVAACPVLDGDTVLAGQASLSIASAHREETTVFNTDDWGMALDSVGILSSPVQGVGDVVLPVSFAVLGNCWPVAIALNIDLLVLRTSLIPATAQPYGQRPELARASQLSGEIKELLSRLDMASAALQPQPVPSTLGLPRRSSVGLRFSVAALATSPVAPEPPPRETGQPLKQSPTRETRPPLKRSPTREEPPNAGRRQKPR